MVRGAIFGSDRRRRRCGAPGGRDQACRSREVSTEELALHSPPGRPIHPGHHRCFEPLSSNIIRWSLRSRGVYRGPLVDGSGRPIAIGELWGLINGAGGGGGNANLVDFTAGITQEARGMFGSLASKGESEAPPE